jgi:hypothetical protein
MPVAETVQLRFRDRVLPVAEDNLLESVQLASVGRGEVYFNDIPDPARLDFLDTVDGGGYHSLGCFSRSYVSKHLQT